jgi:hypothetical protein
MRAHSKISRKIFPRANANRCARRARIAPVRRCLVNSRTNRFCHERTQRTQKKNNFLCGLGVLLAQKIARFFSSNQ